MKFQFFREEPRSKLRGIFQGNNLYGGWHPHTLARPESLAASTRVFRILPFYGLWVRPRYQAELFFDQAQPCFRMKLVRTGISV